MKMITMIKPKPGVIISAYALPGLKGNYKFPIGLRSGDKADFIERITSDYFGITVTGMKAKSRIQNTVSARHISMFLLRRYTNLSLKAIAARFGQDHTTVINALKHVENLMETDEIMRHIVQSLEERVQ